MRLSHLLSAATALAAVAFVPSLAQASDGIFDEIRIGGYEHDISLLGHQKEKGADIGAELLFTSPDLLSVIWSPRPIVGFLANTSGETDQVYAGLTWTWDFWQGIFSSDDGFYLEGTLGGSVHNGKLDVTDPYESQHRKSLGSPVLFREDVDIGYRFDRTWSLAFSFNHISDANLANRNEGVNDAGLRIGMKF